MLMSLRNSVSGINTMQARIDATADNIAGINTTAFKRERVSFADLMYKEMSESKRPVNPNSGPLSSGTGVRPVAVTKVHTQGTLLETGRDTDLAISGNGYFRVILPDGETAYTRNGAFRLSSEGELVTSDGYLLDPEIVLPEGYKELIIRQNGKVEAIMSDDTVNELGDIPLYKFVNPDALLPLGKSLYSMTDEAGIEEEGIPGQEGFGVIEQKKLESSNIDLSVEMLGLIESQRAYQVNSRALRVSDELWSMANNLRKY